MKKLLNLLLLPVVIGLILALYSFAGKRFESRKVADINISFTDYSDPLISETNVNKLLIQSEQDSDNLLVENLDLNKSEMRLVADPMIRTAEVSVDLNGMLNVVVEQREPVARVVGKQDQYLDSDNKLMPLSAEHTVLVPIITGLQTAFQDQVFELLQVLRNDPLLKMAVTQIKLDRKGNATLFLRSSDMRLRMGKLEKIEAKLFNFKAMLAKLEKDKTTQQIDWMDLRFDGQVIVVKK